MLIMAPYYKFKERETHRAILLGLHRYGYVGNHACAHASCPDVNTNIADHPQLAIGNKRGCHNHLKLFAHCSLM